jgi:hypothetical protein
LLNIADLMNALEECAVRLAEDAAQDEFAASSAVERDHARATVDLP